MKKISFGSFPFTNIDKNTRDCLDKYLIKAFADQIVLTDIFKNINTAKDFVYLTPETIIDSLYNFKKGKKTKNVQNPSRGFYTYGLKEAALDHIEYNDKFLIEEGNEILIFESNRYSIPIKQDFLIPLNTKTLSVLEEASGGSGGGSKPKGSKPKGSKPKGSKPKGSKPYENNKKPGYVDPYMSIIKRAYLIVHEFYKKLSADPFYKNFTVLPVYSEKLTDLNYSKLERSKYEYSFFILTNDLLNDSKLDEVSYNNNEILITLYIFSQLYPNKTLTDFEEKDLELIIKLYSFFERNHVDPILFFQLIYTMSYIFSQDRKKSLKDFDLLMTDVIKNRSLQKAFDITTMKLIRKAIISYSKKNPRSENIVSILTKTVAKDFKKTIFNINSKTFKPDEFVKIIFGNQELQTFIIDVFEEAEHDPNIIKRQQVRFRNIILLFKELATLNNKKLNDIIMDANFDLQFKVQYQNKGVIYNDVILKRKIDETFQNFINDFNNYVKKFSDTLNNKIDNNKDLRQHEHKEITRLLTQIKDIEKQIERITNEDSYSNSSDPRYFENTRIINELNNQKALLISQINSLNITKYIEDKTPTGAHFIRGRYVKQKLYDGDYNDQNTTDFHDYARDIDVTRKIMATNDYDRDLNMHKGVDLNNDVNMELESAKTELGDLYRTLNKNLINENVLSAYLNKICDDTLDEVGFDNIVHKYKSNPMSMYADENDLIGQFFNDINIDIEAIVDVLIEEVKANFESELQGLIAQNTQNTSIKKKMWEGFKRAIHAINNEWDDYRENMIKSAKRFLINRVLKVICRFVQRDVKKGEVNFKETINGIHPLLAKMAKNPNNFKSFIFDFDTLVKFYELTYLTDLQKYYAGISLYKRPLIDMPMKYNNPKNMIDFVISDVLKLKNNPLWIISKKDIYLSLPDSLSLVNSRVFNKIQKNNIKNYCKINYNKIMNQNDFGKLTRDNYRFELASMAEKSKKNNNNKDDKSYYSSGGSSSYSNFS